MSIKRMGKAILIAPLVVTWDILYWMISKLYKYASFVDQFGGEKIDAFLNEGE